MENTNPAMFLLCGEVPEQVKVPSFDLYIKRGEKKWKVHSLLMKYS